MTEKRPRRVFLSHTAEFSKYPENRSFIDAAVAAVNRAGDAPSDMQYFTARDQKPADYCREKVRACDIYIGIFGFRYGSPVRDRPEVSYTELEFEAASQPPKLERFVFSLAGGAKVPLERFSDTKYGERQQQFRARLRGSENDGITVPTFADPHELEKLIYQALVESSGAQDAVAGEVEMVDWPEGKSPYPGLEWFDEEYSDLFFGRDREVNEVIAKIGEPGGRFLIVSGDSGSGKSSLVAAGVRNALIHDDRLPGSSDWRWLRIQPADGETPFHSLASGLRQVFQHMKERPGELAEALHDDPEKIAKLLVEQLADAPELVLFVDQAEELFTAGFESDTVVRFLDTLLAATRQREGRLRVIITVRGEYLTRLGESEGIRELVLNGGYNYILGRVSPRALQEMVEKPAQATGYEFAPKLVDKILDEAKQEPGNMPLVAYALKELFERRKGQTFTRKAYDAMEGVAGAIGKNADRVMENLDEATAGAFDQVFSELVHVPRDAPPHSPTRPPQ